MPNRAVVSASSEHAVPRREKCVLDLNFARRVLALPSTLMPISRPTSPPPYTTFRTHCLLPNLPTLLPASLISPWPPFTLSLLHSFSSAPITLHNCVDSFTSLSTVGALLEKWEEGGEELYLRDWHLPLLLLREGRMVEELYEVPELWRDDWMNGYYCAETGDDFRFVVSAELGGERRR